MASRCSSGLTAALSWLEANQQEINDLNVFPVPDGDTGSNMYLTLRSAVEEAGDAPEPAAVDSVLAAAAHGSLMGARGNSGVILSQILRGFAQGVAQRSRVDARGVAVALNEAAAVAYRAVMKPTEGTILTVVRDAAAAGNAAADETDDIRVVLDRVVAEAHAAVERTIDQLQVLRDANVVDAGGFGLAVILEGFARAIASTATLIATPSSLTHKPGEPALRPATEARRDPGDRVRRATSRCRGRRRPRAGMGLLHRIPHQRSWPRRRGDPRPNSVRSANRRSSSATPTWSGCTSTPAIRPTLIAAASSRGRMSKLKVEDMSIQHHEVLAAR